jgi:hypothetical protein
MTPFWWGSSITPKQANYDVIADPNRKFTVPVETAVFEAIADGRAAAHVYPPPSKTDYDALAGDLMRRGWTQADMLFSDERALAHAGSAKVCQMVHDWFAAQLAITDLDMQLCLLVDSLKPVVAG